MGVKKAGGVYIHCSLMILIRKGMFGWGIGIFINKLYKWMPWLWVVYTQAIHAGDTYE